jgi:3-carboxy-cis,cis-muconate cycloisomerase
MPHPSLLDALAGDEEVSALLADEAQLDAMLAFEKALATAEADAGLIGENAASAIAAAVDCFEPDWSKLAEGMARDGVVVPELVCQLRAVVGEPHGKVVHLGATSQDVIDTALVLQLAKVIGVLEERIAALQEAFAGLAERYGKKELMAHTRMQAALPITVADKIASWSEPLRRQLRALEAMRPSLLVVQLGGPVGDSKSFSGEGERIARHLGRSLDLGLAEPWHATRDPLVAFGSLLSLITGSLGKFGADVALLAQSEVGAITLSGGGGSSAMPHKSNPVKAEVLVSLARHTAGLAGTLHQAMVHENERSGAAWTLEWLTLPQMAINAAASLRLANALAGEIAFSAR